MQQTTVILALQLACEFGLEIKIWLMEILMRDGGGTDDC